MPSQTRKKGQARSPKVLGDLEWLRDPHAMLARAHSFEGKQMTDEEFYAFFEQIGEVWSPSKNLRRSKNKPKSKETTKNKTKKKRI